MLRAEPEALEPVLERRALEAEHTGELGGDLERVEVPGDREQLGLVGLGALDDVVQDGAAGGVVGQQAEEEAPGEGLRLELRAGDRPREPCEERGAARVGRGVGLLGSTVLDALGEAHLAA